MLLRRPCGVFAPLWIVFLCLGFHRIFFIDAFQAPRVVPGKSSSRPAPLQQSASLEEGEDLLYYGAKAQQRKNEQEQSPPPHPVVQRVYETWLWTYEKPDGASRKTFKINYRVEGVDNHGPPILLVHGFGANVNHFRNNFPALVEAGYTVYALDLLGFGASDKPLDAATTGFSIELFVQQINDFITAMQEQDEGPHDKKQPWSIAGNSIGGLSCLGVAAGWEEKKNSDEKPNFDLRSVVLFNTSGGMTGFRYEYVPFWARPIMAFVQHVVLGPVLGGFFFRNFRSPDNIQQILQESGVYTDRTHVDDELLEILLAPADDPGAEQVFLAVFGGPPGPTPEFYLRRITRTPVLALWGATDPWTPVDAGMHPGTAMAQYCDTFRLDVLPATSHCPHDEAPHLVNPKMIGFLKQVEDDAAVANQGAKEEETRHSRGGSSKR